MNIPDLRKRLINNQSVPLDELKAAIEYQWQLRLTQDKPRSKKPVSERVPSEPIDLSEYD